MNLLGFQIINPEEPEEELLVTPKKTNRPLDELLDTVLGDLGADLTEPAYCNI